MNNILLRVNSINKSFQVSHGYFFSRRVGSIQAVRDFSIEISRGESFGLVGESGCGKTTAGRIIANLLPGDSGEIYFEGIKISADSTGKPDLKKKIQFIFQDPLSSLDPRQKIFYIVLEPLVVHRVGDKKSREEETARILEEVGLGRTFFDRYPHQLSGGQRQRVMIARSLVLSPGLVIADEPVSALDVSIQAQILNLFKNLQDRKNFSSLFISHDLAVVSNICRRVGVMYMGAIVESGPVDQVFSNPLHPYTRGLIESCPDIGKGRKCRVIPGEIPNPLSPPPGCSFQPRCPAAGPICAEEEPALKTPDKDRFVACHMV